MVIVQPTAPEDDLLLPGQSEDPDSAYEVSPSVLIRQAAAELQKSRGGAALPAIPLNPEQAVARAIRNSQYDGSDRDRLRAAVLSAICGEKTMKVPTFLTRLFTP